jgi:hypothetical protein
VLGTVAVNNAEFALVVGLLELLGLEGIEQPFVCGRGTHGRPLSCRSTDR